MRVIYTKARQSYAEENAVRLVSR